MHDFEGELILHGGLIFYRAQKLSGSTVPHVRTDYKWGPNLPNSRCFLVHTNTDRPARVLHVTQTRCSVLGLLLRLEPGSCRTLEHTGTAILQEHLLYRAAHGKKQLVEVRGRAAEAQVLNEDAAGFCQKCSIFNVDRQSVCVGCVYRLHRVAERWCRHGGLSTTVCRLR